MRLKEVKIIGEYKNLKDFKLVFDGTSFIDVFVGKNGTGKSNLFEALIEIFRHLYENDHAVTFDYEIKYVIEGKEVEVSWIKGKLLLNKKVFKAIPKNRLPENILIYYSGHNTKVTELIQTYEREFKGKIKDANIKDTRTFIGIGGDYKSLLLAVLLLQKDGNKAKEFIKKKLGIKSVGNEIKIVLKRPFYAQKSGYDIDIFDKATRYWKAEGITNEFLAKLSTVESGNSNGKVRQEGYFNKDERYADEYILYYNIEDFQKKFKGLEIQELFRLLDNLKTIEMLHDISLDVTLENGFGANINQFSDGQFQSVYIYAIIEIFKNKNCLTLLDEPDSFLHPEWQFEFLKQVFNIAENTATQNHVLMSSHSAVTLIPYEQRRIKLFNFIENKLQCYEVSKSYAISQMSSNLIQYSEEEQILSVLNTINVDNKPVFFTEGSTDTIILKTAWGKLYKGTMPFIPIMAFSCSFLRLLLQDNRIVSELGNKPFFGLFDFDEAYNEWNSLQGERIQTDPYKGLLIDIANKPSYAFMLPVPKIKDIEKQVIKNNKETYCHESRMTIEHLFYGDKKTHPYFINESKPGGGTIITMREGSKPTFAKKVVPKIAKEHFSVFKPMFEFIISKCK